MKYVPKSKRTIQLFRLVSEKEIPTIKKEGLKRRSNKNPIVPERKFCIFAYDEETARYVDKFPGNKDDWWVEFFVDSSQVYVGDLDLEDKPELYRKSFIPYSKYLGAFVGFKEAEMVIITDIPKKNLVKFYKRGELTQ